MSMSSTSSCGQMEVLTVSDGTDKEALINLMDRLRARAGPQKSWGEISKAFRLFVCDKRAVGDSADKSCVQRVLDILQKSIKVTSLQSMIERLDSITRQQGLKFTRRTSTECYISSDMFYVEILLHETGEVHDVKIADDEPEPVSSSELTKVLRSGNFSEFTKHLEGLTAIYQLNADNFRQLDYEAQKKQKKKAYLALQSLEIDLSTLAQLQSSINDPSNLVHKSPVGILQERQGGFSLKLTYFISPYDLLDLETKSSIPLTVDTVVEKGLGQSVTVCIEGSSAHKLQTVSLISVSKTQEGKSIPSFAALSNLNSTTLPASFVLKLPEPVPVASSILRKIQGVTKISECVDANSAQSLLSVIISSSSKGQLEGSQNRDLYVTLPDQQHVYSMKSNTDLQGVLISSIPFTHPTHVPQILVFLRQQMLFNTVIGSCIRPGSKKCADSALKFDVHAYSTSHIQVTFVHPLDESLAAVDLDLRDITNVKCKIYTLGNDDSLCSDEYASKVMQRCLSVPITMRAVIRKAQGQQQQAKPPDNHDMYGATIGDSSSVPYLSHIPSNYNTGMPNGSSFSGGDFSNLASRMCSKSSDKIDRNLKTNSVHPNNHIQNSIIFTDAVCIKMEKKKLPGKTDEYGMRNVPNVKNPFLETFLSHTSNSDCHVPGMQPKNSNLMLMSMLSDVASGTPSSGSLPFLVQNINDESSCKGPKPRKRRATNDGGLGCKSPKRKHHGEVDMHNESMIEALAIERTSTDLSSLDCASSDDPLQVECASLSKDCPVSNEIQQPVNYSERSQCVESHSSSTSAFEPLANSENSQSSDGITSKSCEFAVAEKQSESPSGTQSISLDNAHHNPNILEKVEVAWDKSAGHCDELVTKISHDAEAILASQKILSTEKIVKKVKKSREDIQDKDKVHGHFGKKGIVADSFKKSVIASELAVLGSCLKSSKSGSGQKTVRPDAKSRQKDSSKSPIEGEESSCLLRRKGETKKERKRKRAESTDSVYQKSPDVLHTNNPTVTSAADSTANESCSAFTVDVHQVQQPHAVSTPSSSSLQSRSPSCSKKATSPVIATKNSSKNSSEKSKAKSLPFCDGGVESSKTSVEVMNECPSGKSPLALKVQNKHKQSTLKGNKCLSMEGTNLSASKRSSTLKLKNVNSVSSPAVPHTKSKNTPLSSCSSHFSSASPTVCFIPSATTFADQSSSPPGGDGCSNTNRTTKTTLHSRKGTILSAVIDKLRAQHPVVPGHKTDGSRSLTEPLAEKKEIKSERKESSGFHSSKSNENKNKYNVSDQFTVKQSSQGIKLTVTKTRSNDGTAKPSKLKIPATKIITADGIISSCCKEISSSNSTAKAHVILAPSKKSASVTNSSKVSYCVTMQSKAIIANSVHKVASHGLNNAVAKTKSFVHDASKSAKVSSLHNRSQIVRTNVKAEKSSSNSESNQEEAKSQHTVAPQKASKTNIPLSTECSSFGSSDAKTESGTMNKEICVDQHSADVGEDISSKLLLDKNRTGESKNDSDKMFSSGKIVGPFSETTNLVKTENIENTVEDNKDTLVSSSTDIKTSLTSNTSKLSQESGKNLTADTGISSTDNTDSNSSAVSECHHVTGSKEKIVVCQFPRTADLSSAHSDNDSSPENLVIDYSEHPLFQKSPDKWTNSHLEVSLNFHPSENKYQKADPFVSKLICQPSPSKSPREVITPPSNNSSSSLSRPSPAVIDDELMNEAVMTVGK